MDDVPHRGCIRDFFAAIFSFKKKSSGYLLWNSFENRKRMFSGRKINHRPYGPKLVIFWANFFSFHFRDGLQPKMGPHFRSTSAIEAGVWIWVSTHRGRQQALRYAENSSSNNQGRVILPSKQ